MSVFPKAKFSIVDELLSDMSAYLPPSGRKSLAREPSQRNTR